MLSLQKFAAVHASVHNHFNAERHLIQPIELQAEPRGRPNKGSGHLVVARHDVIQTLQGLAKFDHSVLDLIEPPTKVMALQRNMSSSSKFSRNGSKRRGLTVMTWSKTDFLSMTG
jgi:hypothetical protein